MTYAEFVRLVPMDHGSTTIILEVTLTAGHVSWSSVNRYRWWLISGAGWSDSFATKYPELAAWLDKHQKFGCPRHISLGAGGFFYIAMMDNSVHWRIPKSVSKRITGYIGERTVRPIQRLWLGYNHDYVAEISDDDYLCNIENYDNLEGLMGDIDSEGASIMVRKSPHSRPRLLTWIKAACYEYWRS